jgi:hypothetical protein
MSYDIVKVYGQLLLSDCLETRRHTVLAKDRKCLFYILYLLILTAKLHSVEANRLTDNTEVAYITRTNQRFCNVVHFALAVVHIVVTVFVPAKKKKKKKSVNPFPHLAQNVDKT